MTTQQVDQRSLAYFSQACWMGKVDIIGQVLGGTVVVGADYTMHGDGSKTYTLQLLFFLGNQVNRSYNNSGYCFRISTGLQQKCCLRSNDEEMDVGDDKTLRELNSEPLMKTQLFLLFVPHIQHNQKWLFQQHKCHNRKVVVPMTGSSFQTSWNTFFQREQYSDVITSRIPSIT